MGNSIENIDLIYLWVDGNDPKWQAQRAAFLGTETKKTMADCEGRYIDNDELMYSLRSVSEYAPWIRNIYIVTDNQVPKWLDTSNPKIHIINQNDILPSNCQPCYNSTVIEHFICDIPGLSEYFLYANDDMFFNRPSSPSDFFTDNNHPIVRLKRRHFRKLWLYLKKKFSNKPVSTYNNTIDISASMVEENYGKYYQGKPHHNIDSYEKSEYKHVRNTFKNEIESTLNHHKRANDDIQRILYQYAPLAEGKASLKYVDSKESLRISINKDKYYRKYAKTNPLLFCLNDSEFATATDRKKAHKFLEKRFPNKSEFEK